MNPDLKKLHSYPFEKMAQLFSGITPASKEKIALSIGEPKHPAPDFVKAALTDSYLSWQATHPQKAYQN